MPIVVDRGQLGDTLFLTLFLMFHKESQMPKLPRRPELLLLEAGLTIILAIELYKFIRFIAG
jgi:hypothetical protein